MKKHFFIGSVALCLFSFFSTGFIIGAENMSGCLELTFTNIDNILRIPRQTANQFSTIRNTLEDLNATKTKSNSMKIEELLPPPLFNINETNAPIYYELMEELIALTDISANQIQTQVHLIAADTMHIAQLVQLANYLDLLDDENITIESENIVNNKLQALATFLGQKLLDPTTTAKTVNEIHIDSDIEQIIKPMLLEQIPPILISRFEDIINDFSPDGNSLLTACFPMDSFPAQLWNIETGKLLHTFQHENDEMRESVGVLSAQFSPDGSLIITASENDQLAKLWDTETGQLLYNFKHESITDFAQFSPNGKSIVTASWDTTAKLWDTETGKLLHTFQHENIVEFAQISPNDNFIVTTLSDLSDIAHLWNTKTGQLLHTFQHNNMVYNACFSSNSNSIITVSADHTAKLWDTKTGQLLHIFQHKNEAWNAHFSPNDNFIVTASKDKTAKLWDTKTGQLLYTFQHKNMVSNAHFSSNGNSIVTSSSNKKATLWSTKTGQLLHTFNNNYFSNSTQFSSDDNFISSGSSLYINFINCTQLSLTQSWHLAQLLKIENKKNNNTRIGYIKENEAIFRNFDQTTKRKLRLLNLDKDIEQQPQKPTRKRKSSTEEEDDFSQCCSSSDIRF